MSRLCIVPTPIGNLEDITLRAIRMLQECAFIYAEDTRVTAKLLKHFDIRKPVYPFHAHNEHKVVNSAVERIAQEELVVLVSDAGTPGISDPGFLLIRACIEAEIPVECLPGATAIVPALVGSGFPSDRFCFEGFLPHKKGRQTRIRELGTEERTVILYESPHRLVKCLAQISELLGPERRVCVVREISKIHEEFRRGTAEEVKDYYEANPPKGEIVVLLEGLKNGKKND